MRFADKKEIIPPIEGWLEKAYYLVEVAWSNGNPIHRAIFYTGFLHNDHPAGYNQLYNGSYSIFEDHSITFVYYMKSIRLLVTFKEMEIE